MGDWADVPQMLVAAGTVAKINTYKLNLLFPCVLFMKSALVNNFYLIHKIFFFKQVNNKDEENTKSGKHPIGDTN